MPKVQMREPVHTDEGGFTLIEILVGLTLLVVGVLGMFTMLGTANTVTSSSLAREGGTNLARDVLERSRQVAYSQLTPAAAQTQLQAQDGLATVAPGQWVVRRRAPGATSTSQAFAYTVNVEACDVDDLSDAGGPRDPATFCSLDTTPPPGGGGGGGGTGIYADMGIFGTAIQTQLNGELVHDSCVLLGQATVSLPTLAEQVAGGADVRVCPSDGAPRAIDNNPRDYKRVTVTVNWDNGRRSLVQRTLIPNPDSAARPGPATPPTS